MNATSHTLVTFLQLDGGATSRLDLLLGRRAERVGRDLQLHPAQVPVAGNANSVRIVVLDVKQKGKQVLESQAIVFPEWVSVTVTYGRTFSSQASVLSGELLLRWKANAFYAGGAPPPPEVIARAEASFARRSRLHW